MNYRQLDLFDKPYHANFVRRKISAGEQWTTTYRFDHESDMREQVEGILRMADTRARIAYVHLCHREDSGRVILMDTIQLEGI